MASQVLSGSSNPTYTNNTGQNVRLVLSFMDNVKTVSWAGVTANLNNFKLDYPTYFWNNNQITLFSNTGQSIFPGYSNDAGTRLPSVVTTPGNFKMTPPHQITLAPGQTFSATCDTYNIIVIKEDGN